MSDSRHTPMKSSIKLMECTTCRDKVQSTVRPTESFENQRHSSTPKRPMPRNNLNYDTVYSQHN